MDINFIRIIWDLFVGFMLGGTLGLVANTFSETNAGKAHTLVLFPLFFFCLIAIPNLWSLPRWEVISILGNKIYAIFLSYGMLFMFWTSKPLTLGSKKITDTLFNYGGIFFYVLGFICIVIGLFLDNDVFFIR